MKPFFSIVIAAYNRANYIEKAVESVLNQNFEDWELVIVDDGSEDNTLEVLEKFNANDKISIITLGGNTGVANARNAGIKIVRGNYLTFLDSDDWYKCNHLESRFNILNESKVDLLHGGVDIIGEDTVPDKNDTSKEIHLSDCVIGGTFFINMETCRELAYFDTSIQYSEDSEMFDRFVAEKKAISKTNIETYVYNRTLDDSICSNQ